MVVRLRHQKEKREEITTTGQKLSRRRRQEGAGARIFWGKPLDKNSVDQGTVRGDPVQAERPKRKNKDFGKAQRAGVDRGEARWMRVHSSARRRAIPPPGRDLKEAGFILPTEKKTASGWRKHCRPGRCFLLQKEPRDGVAPYAFQRNHL